MAKYLFKASYTPEGIKGVMKEGGSSRVNADEKTVAGLGGTLESFYFAFGATDVFVTVDLPDHATAVAFAAAVGSTGSLSTTETIVLLTPGEIDAAIHKSVNYRAPGSSFSRSRKPPRNRRNTPPSGASAGASGAGFDERWAIGWS